MLTPILVSLLKSVCCFALVGNSVAYITSGTLFYDSTSILLNGVPLCLCSTAVAVRSYGRVAVFIIRGSRLMSLLNLNFVPSECSCSTRFLAFYNSTLGLAAVYDMDNKALYVFKNVTLIKVYDDVIVTVSGKKLNVYAAPSGYTIKLPSTPNDLVLLDNETVLCTNRGVFALHGDFFKRLWSGNCDTVSAWNDEIAIASGVNVLLLKDDKVVLRLSFSKLVKRIAIVKNDLFVLSDNNLYVYKIINIDENDAIIIVLIPLLVVLLHFLIKALRD